MKKLAVLGLAELIEATNTARAMDYITSITKEIRQEKVFKDFKDSQIVFIKEEEKDLVFAVLDRNLKSSLFTITQNETSYSMGCTEPEEDLEFMAICEMKKVMLMSRNDCYKVEV